MLILPLTLYIMALAALILVIRYHTTAPREAMTTAVLVCIELAAFGVGTCSALIGMPSNEIVGTEGRYWPVCLVLATVSVICGVAGLGRLPVSTASPSPPRRNPARGWLLLLCIASILAAVAIIEATVRR